MGSRRSHTKSRNGCTQCKSRRIKVNKPFTSLVHLVICPNRALSSRSTSSSTGASSSQQPSTPTTHPAPSHSSTTSVIGPPPNTSTIPRSSGLDVIDLELLHHYTTFTYKTLPSGATSDQHEIWQIQVVQLGFQHEFLLRGILAVAALHLSYLHPQRREPLALRASTHQSIAVKALHEVLNRVDPFNCVAIFAFSCILVALTFAAPTNPALPGVQDGYQGAQKEILDWFHMVRGCNSVLQTQWGTLSRSFLAPLLHKAMTQQTAPSHDVHDSDRVTDLLRLCSSERVAQDRETANAYALAIHQLLNAYTQVSILSERKQDFVPVIFVWPIAIPQTYLKLLGERKPEAMVILAHYSALLQRLDDQWFMKGWARYLVKQIEMTLGEEWQPWLCWPKEVTGV
ncbi:C6 zinc finger domain-containing protein [Histoplasma capsulatum]|uniref:C6 zinc finger domain-containing protein n=1 Tax=Ajellomyces capsulatus TaxID=5037 RepID=A0A8A1M611_AJECA|nr:C6 zinc finger domain-containing protein [Histoplasma capsulatum]